MIRNGDGDTVELVCIVHARPQPSVLWSKDGLAVDAPHVQEQYQGHRHSLRITQVGIATQVVAIEGQNTPEEFSRLN